MPFMGTKFRRHQEASRLQRSGPQALISVVGLPTARSVEPHRVREAGRIPEDSGQLRTTFDWKIGRVHSLALAPDGMIAAVGGGDSSLVVWDLDGLEP